MVNEIVNKLHYEFMGTYLIWNSCFVSLGNLLFISKHLCLTVNCKYAIRDCLKGNDKGVVSYYVAKGAWERQTFAHIIGQYVN